MLRSFKTSDKNRTKYIYYGVDGAKVVIEPGTEGVTKAHIEMLHSMDDKYHDIERKETRRHESLEEMNDKAENLVDQTVNLEKKLICEEEQNSIITNVHKATKMLKPQQQELIRALYLSDNPISQAEYAEQLGIEESSVSQKAWRAKNRLKEIIKKVFEKV